jgi:hypothetical protein
MGGERLSRLLAAHAVARGVNAACEIGSLNNMQSEFDVVTQANFGTRIGHDVANSVVKEKVEARSTAAQHAGLREQ